MPPKTAAVINSTGRQAASFIRAASAVGWRIRAQIRRHEGLVADELAALPNVQFLEGDLAGPPDVRNALLAKLFDGANIAFINTVHWGDEVAIGKACADAAKKAGVAHYVYSSMPDHSTFPADPPYRALPMWASKFAVENYVRALALPATFVYTGIYNNNFTSLPYPLFRMEETGQGGFVWRAPFHPDVELPWLDAEHDVGPALLQIFKMGVRCWKGQRVTLAFEKLTPLQVCALFSRGLNRPVTYIHEPNDLHISVPLPSGYREHLEILAETLGRRRAPYFGPYLEYPAEARSIWEGWRGIEEYAREVFWVEEQANGMRWMEEDADGGNGGEEGSSSWGGSRPMTPAVSGIAMPSGQIAGGYTPGSHPESFSRGFFVGSV